MHSCVLSGGDPLNRCLWRFSYLCLIRPIHLLAQRQQAGKVSNPAGFLLTALRKNYGNARLEQEEKGRARQREAQELRAMQEQRRRLARERDDALQEISNQILAALPGLLPEALGALRQQRDAMLSRYDGRRSPLENYRERPSVQIAVGNWLQRRFPERFEQPRQSFAAQLAELDARIGEIEGKRPKSVAAG